MCLNHHLWFDYVCLMNILWDALCCFQSYWKLYNIGQLIHKWINSNLIYYKKCCNYFLESINPLNEKNACMVRIAAFHSDMIVNIYKLERCDLEKLLCLFSHLIWHFVHLKMYLRKYIQINPLWKRLLFATLKCATLDVQRQPVIQGYSPVP